MHKSSSSSIGSGSPEHRRTPSPLQQQPPPSAAAPAYPANPAFILSRRDSIDAVIAAELAADRDDEDEDIGPEIYYARQNLQSYTAASGHVTGHVFKSENRQFLPASTAAAAASAVHARALPAAFAAIKQEERQLPRLDQKPPLTAAAAAALYNNTPVQQHQPPPAAVSQQQLLSHLISAPSRHTVSLPFPPSAAAQQAAAVPHTQLRVHAAAPAHPVSSVANSLAGIRDILKTKNNFKV